MTLVQNASKWYRMFSMQALIFVGAIQMIVLALPASVLSAHVPFMGAFTYGDVNALLTVIAAVFGAIGRLVNQDSTTP
jgi:hypothetical protein